MKRTRLHGPSIELLVFSLIATTSESESLDTEAIEEQLPGLLGTFGTIEWILGDDGVVTEVFTADGKFSVGTPGACIH